MPKIDKLLAEFVPHLQEGEGVKFYVMGGYETTILGRKSARNGIFVATDRRLVFYSKKMTGYDMEAFPYESISSIETGKATMGHTLKVFASGNSVQMKWINNPDFQKMVAFLQERIGKRPQAAPAAPDPVSQLERLAALRDSGVLTDAEFEAKKADILARI